jgi:hypothetical protein
MVTKFALCELHTEAIKHDCCGYQLLSGTPPPFPLLVIRLLNILLLGSPLSCTAIILKCHVSK